MYERARRIVRTVVLWIASLFRPAPVFTAPAPPTFPTRSPRVPLYVPSSYMHLSTGISYLASGAVGVSMPSTDMASVPADGEDRVSSVVDLGLGYRAVFKAWAVATNSQSGTNSVGKVVIDIVSEVGVYGQNIVDTSTSSLNSPVTSVSWVASMIESRLKSVGVDIPPVDMGALEAASSKVWKDAVVHCISAFAYFYVDRVTHEDVQDLWRNAEIRYVMTR